MYFSGGVAEVDEVDCVIGNQGRFERGGGSKSVMGWKKFKE